MAIRRRGRMAKTQTVPVRLDPALKWAAELAAGHERRSLNSFIEWAVEQAVKRVDVGIGYDAMGDRILKSAWSVANECWHILPLLRLHLLSERHPAALTVKERAIHQAMLQLFDKDEFIHFYENADVWEVLEQFGAEEISFEELRQKIDILKGIARNETHPA